MQDATLQSTPGRQGIDATNRRFESAFQAGDPTRAAQEVYTRNARVLPPGSPLIQGRDSIAGFWQAAAEQLGIQRVELSTLELEIHDAHAHEIGRGTLFLAGGQEVVAKYVVIWKQEAGQWRWDIDIWNT